MPQGCLQPVVFISNWYRTLLNGQNEGRRLDWTFLCVFLEPSRMFFAHAVFKHFFKTCWKKHIFFYFWEPCKVYYSISILAANILLGLYFWAIERNVKSRPELKILSFVLPEMVWCQQNGFMRDCRGFAARIFIFNRLSQIYSLLVMSPACP